MQMATAPERQRQGVGSLVLAEVHRLLTERGVPLVWCHARSYAVPFYASAGWQVVGEEFLRYPEPDEPVPHFCMYRELPAPAHRVGVGREVRAGGGRSSVPRVRRGERCGAAARRPPADR